MDSCCSQPNLTALFSYTKQLCIKRDQSSAIFLRKTKPLDCMQSLVWHTGRSGVPQNSHFTLVRTSIMKACNYKAMEISRCLPLALCTLSLCLLISSSSAYKMGSMAKFESELRELVWLEPEDMFLYGITEAGRLWRSSDAGASWKDVTSKLEGAMDSTDSLGQYNPPVGVQAIHYHPKKPAKILFRGAAEDHWITEDSGETYTKIKGPAGQLGLMTIRFHPTETDWILLTARRWSCWSEDLPVRQTCADDLFVSQNFGKTWSNLTEQAHNTIISFVDFDWGWSKSDDVKHPTAYKKETILASVYENRADVAKHIQGNSGMSGFGWDQYVDFVRSDDLFKSKHVRTVPCGNQFEILNDILFLAVASHCGKGGASGNGVTLKLSRDYGTTFLESCFPRPLTQRGYSVVHATDDSVYINVDNAEGARAIYGNLYASDASLSVYSLSLQHNSRSLTSNVDFAPMAGIPGVFVANQVYRWDDPDLPAYMKEGKTSFYDRTMNRMSTLITFNSGAKWQAVKPPEYDSNHRRIECKVEEGCGLHLHGASNWDSLSDIPGFAFVYSHPSTPGMIMSTGNVGRFLYQDSEVNTYLSRNAGRTWEEVAKGANIYEFGDSGGVIVRAKHYLQGSTDRVFFSLDEGLSWTTVNLEEEIDVYNIRVESENEGRTFLIQGLEKAGVNSAPDQRRAVVIPIDFTVGSQYKICARSDYELWSPSADGCILGEQWKLERQVRTSVCWNGGEYERPEAVRTPCNCSTEEDFECDFGMVRNVHTGACEAIKGADLGACPYVKNGQYTLSKTKLRRVAGDHCTGLGADSSQFSSVPGSKRGRGMSMAGTLLLILLSFVVTAGLGFGFLVYRGQVPDDILQRIPLVDWLRYRNLRGNFQSFNDDFGLEGDDDDYVEFRR